MLVKTPEKSYFIFRRYNEFHTLNDKVCSLDLPKGSFGKYVPLKTAARELQADIYKKVSSHLI